MALTEVVEKSVFSTFFLCSVLCTDIKVEETKRKGSFLADKKKV